MLGKILSLKNWIRGIFKWFLNWIKISFVQKIPVNIILSESEDEFVNKALKVFNSNKDKFYRRFFFLMCVTDIGHLLIVCNCFYLSNFPFHAHNFIVLIGIFKRYVKSIKIRYGMLILSMRKCSYFLVLNLKMSQK